MSGLYDLDYGARKVNSRDAENYELLVIGKNRIHPRSFEKMVETIDLAIANLKPSENSKLTWASCASLIGYSSKEPTNSTDHLWKKAAEAFRHHTKTTNMFVGGLVRWRISLLKDTWLCMRDERDELDIDTGKPIKVATYWVNNNFVPQRPEQKRGFTVADLSSKFNKNIHV